LLFFSISSSYLHMTNQKLYTQDNYSTELSAPVLTSSWDIEVQVKVAPSFSRGYIFIGPASNPEVAYFYNKSGNTLYIAGPSRTNATAHPQGDPVSISNTAAIINRIEDNSVTTHTPEIIGMLAIRILGGIYYTSWSANRNDASNVDFVLEDNTTTYIYFCFASSSVKKGYILADITNNASAEYGELLCTVITAGGRIVSVTQDTARKYVSYNDINLGGVNTETPDLANSYIATLAADTPDANVLIAIKNPWDTVDKQMEAEDLFAHAQDQWWIDDGATGYTHTQASAASTWTIAHNFNNQDVSFTCYTNATPQEILIPDGITRNLNSLVLTFAGHSYAWSCVVMAPVGTASANSTPAIDLTAGEDLDQADMVRMGISGRESGINASYIPSPVTTTFDTVSSSKTLYQTFKAQRSGVTKVALYAKKTAAPDTTALTVEIYATTTSLISGNTYNVPTGPALGTATIAHGSLTTTAAWVTGTLSSAITTLTPDAYYAIKIVWVGAENVQIGQGADGVSYLTNGFQFISSLTPIVGDYAFKVQHADLASEVTSRVYKASAFELTTSVIAGANKVAVSSGGTSRVETHIGTTFSSLTEWVTRYLSDIPGRTSTSQWTNSVVAGLPISTTSLIIR